MANIIDILFSRHDKEEYHNRVLGWLVNPAGDHGCGRKFLDRLCQLAFPDWKLDEIEQVKQEQRLAEGSVVDISVIGVTRVLLIENKIRFESIRTGQIERYMEDASKAYDGQLRLIWLLPGKPKQFEGLSGTLSGVTIVYWSQLLELLLELLNEGEFAAEAGNSIEIYVDYVAQNHGEFEDVHAMRPTTPGTSKSFSGETKPLRVARRDFLRAIPVECNLNYEVIDLVRALVGFLDQLEHVQIGFSKGATHYSMKASIPRSDGGRTLIMGCYANGSVYFEYRRLPDELAAEYRERTGATKEVGWKEFKITEINFSAMLKTVREICDKASKTSLPVVP